jgi:uncharacterized protein YfeS
MTANGTHQALSRDTSHAKARAALDDDYFWKTDDPMSPFGTETAIEVLEAYREARDDEPPRSALEVLASLLARWEVEDAHWDVVDAEAVEAIGAEDEYGLLSRDEIILALAFAEIVEEGRLDAEIQRRALVALKRQELPALLHGWGERAAERALRIQTMREALGGRWR